MNVFWSEATEELYISFLEDVTFTLPKQLSVPEHKMQVKLYSDRTWAWPQTPVVILEWRYLDDDVGWIIALIIILDKF